MRVSALLLLLLGGLGLNRSHIGGGVSAQKTDLNVQVDLRPCFLTQVDIAPDTDDVTEAYVFYQLFQGMWASSIKTKLVTPEDQDLDLTDSSDALHGLCSVVFVAIVPSTSQFTILTEYSQKFQVRIVYFDEALTADNPDFTTKLGVGNYNAGALTDIQTIKLTGDAEPRVVNSNLMTFPQPNNIYTRPVRKTGAGVGGTVTVVAEYGDAEGASITVTETWISGDTSGSNTYDSVAAVTFDGDNGEEEMHVFFAMGWFDVGSWAWAHYIAEWATKGIFAGERRFWLGAVVDDLYLGTNVFDNTMDNNEGTEERMEASHLTKLLDATTTLNAKYHSEIVTEFALNGLGILEQVDSAERLDFDNADAALLAKGEPPQDNEDGTLGMDDIHSRTWLSQGTIDAMTEEFSSSDSTKNWKVNDLLLAETITLKERFFWQSHTLSHLARDDLGLSDCYTEDTGNTEIAVLIGLYEASTYNWRSMTTPGITGLFNPNCLESAAANLITCAPGDNTYDGVQTTVRLVTDNQFHALETTLETNGYEGALIVPRFATFVYYNCVTPDCLVLENLSIRRTVCGCTTTDPGTMDALELDKTGCTEINDSGLCSAGLEAFGTSDALFLTEAETTARWIMTGRRDKYMFHQANVIPTTIKTTVDGAETTVNRSLLEHWYEVVMAYMANYLNLEGTDPFVLTSKKFDDLCTNFIQHAELDASASLITVTKNAMDQITGMTLSNTGSVGVIPVTIPATMIDDVDFDGLPAGQPYLNVDYGSDRTYYVASSEADEPVTATMPTGRTTAFLPTPAPTPAPNPQSNQQLANSAGAPTCPDGENRYTHPNGVTRCAAPCPGGQHHHLRSDGTTHCTNNRQ